MKKNSCLAVMVACVVLLIPCGVCAEGGVVAPGAEIEKLFDGGFFLEGPAAAPDGSVYFSDITYSSRSGMQAGHIWRYDPATGETSIFRSPSGMSNGIIFDREGRMVVCEGADFGGRRVTQTDMKTRKSYILAGLYNGLPFNSPNDLAMDDQGRIYFTDPRTLGHEPVYQSVMGIYCIDTDGSVRQIAAGLWQPNGIAVSPDQKTLYVITVGGYNWDLLRPTGSGRVPDSAVHVYGLRKDGTVKYRKALIEFTDYRYPDGMAVDAQGNLYVAMFGLSNNHGVYVYTPEGKRLDYIPTPEKAVNVEFGVGRDANLLYIVTEHCLWRIRLNRAGYKPQPVQ